ncbi:MAG: hypothetical protein UU87_C0006G0003 [Parcubacteria group bacterium GW2011_GWA2_42_11]|nr:MAG: hypothetical protein UU87_C0006G0003 [Parcubacteria group bacterium GW2011_GWA2_42_11]
MKKLLLFFIIIIILLLVAGYLESSYCHYWTTVPPPGIAEDKYINNSKLCKWNAYPGLVGVLLLKSLDVVVDQIH